MLLQQIITSQSLVNYEVLSERCSDFILESSGNCLLKNLPKTYSNIHKIKARKRNINGEFASTLNEAFETYFNDIAQRAIFSNGQSSFQISENPDLEPFYIFPIDGYKYMYSPEVMNSSADYKDVLDVMFEQFGTDKGKNIVTEVIKFAYEHKNLSEGIIKGSEIIIYDIPYYYGVKCSSISNYQDLICSL